MVLLEVAAVGLDGDWVVLDVITPPIDGLVEPELLAGLAFRPNNELKACAGFITAPLMNPPMPEPKSDKDVPMPLNASVKPLNPVPKLCPALATVPPCAVASLKNNPINAIPTKGIAILVIDTKV